MAYINRKGHTALSPGDRVILKEKHANALYSFEEGEEVRIKCAMEGGGNYYCIMSLDGEKRVDGAVLGGLADNSIVITHNEGAKNPPNEKTGDIAAEMVKLMMIHAEKQEQPHA